MYHIQSSVHIRRRGPYLSVSVIVPINLQGTLTSSESLCTTGCRNRSIIEIDKVLAASSKYARCYARKLHVPIKLAIERCKTVNATDRYFDACVFDLMLTGNNNYSSIANLFDEQIQFDLCTINWDRKGFKIKKD
ncbi:hypothetical protein OSTOST_24912 [Ostertagia ostertagi]